MTNIISLDITPAFFVGWTKNGAILLCYLGQSRLNKPIVQKRIFDKLVIEHINTPTKILIGTKQETITEEGKGMIRRVIINFICGKQHRKAFTWLQDTSIQYKKNSKQK